MNHRIAAIAEGALRRLSSMAPAGPDTAVSFGETRAVALARAAHRGGEPASYTPELQVFESIGGPGEKQSGRCVVESDKQCIGCSGRCRTLGF